MQLVREKFYQEKGTDLSKNFQKKTNWDKNSSTSLVPIPNETGAAIKISLLLYPIQPSTKTQNDPQNHKNNQQHTEKHSPNGHTITNTHTKTTCKQQ